MPQLVIIGLVAVGGVLAYRFIKREIARVDGDLNRRKSVNKKGDGQTLVYDEETGKYRPKSKG